jgi:predicted PurR-regulated permease PerM
VNGSEAVRPQPGAGAGSDDARAGGSTGVRADVHAPDPDWGSARSPVTPRTVLTVAVTLAGFLGALYLLYLLRDIVQWVCVATFLAVAMSPLVGAIQRRRVPRTAAVLLSFALVLALLLGAAALLLPVLLAQVGALVDFVSAPPTGQLGLVEAAQALADRYGLGSYLLTLRAEASAISSRLLEAAGALFSLTRAVVGSATALVSILVMAFFLLVDGERFVDAALNLVGPAERARAGRVLDASAGAIRGYVHGNLLISLAAGTGALLAMTVLSLPYAVALAVVVGVLDLIPMIGATLGAGICVLVALFVDPTTAAILALYFVLYQQLENYLLTPLVYGRSVSLHPLTVFVAILAGGQLLGILGALLAIPVAEIVRIVAVEWLAGRAHRTDTDLPS